MQLLVRLAIRKGVGKDETALRVAEAGPRVGLYIQYSLGRNSRPQRCSRRL